MFKKIKEVKHTFPIRAISVSEYHRMGEIGILSEDERVELIDGVLKKMSPKGTKHTASVSKLANLLPRLLEGKAWLRVQDPIVLNDDTEPEPDLALVKPRDDDYAEVHPCPDDVLLLIEVSDTSLDEDREVKLPRYAASGIPEVWIVNLVENIIEIYRKPLFSDDGTCFGYRTLTNFVKGDALIPQAFPDLEITVSDILV